MRDETDIDQLGGRWFDESFDERGRLRPAYAALRGRTGQDPLRPTATVVERLGVRPFDDDIRIIPVPVVLDEDEYRATLQPGLTQRARALQRLFADLILGRQRILDAKVGLTADVVEEILTADGWSPAGLRDLWRTRDRADIRFVYGPDLVRDPTGRWTVLEDNTGCVGGSADSFFVADRYRHVTGLPGCPSCRPDPDLAMALRRWLGPLGPEAGDRPGGRVVAVLGCEAGGDGASPHLDENARRRRILDTLGIPVVDGRQLQRRLAAGGEGPTAVVNFVVDRSWADAFGRPGTTMLNAPGTGALGNKALLPYLGDIVRLYLGQEPILATPTTRLLTDGVLPSEPDQWVIKTTAGCQGTGVFVLAWQEPDQLRRIADRVRREWTGAAAVAQRYVEPSRLTPTGPGGHEGYRVELRPVSYVLGWDDVHAAEQPVGKVVPSADGHRLNNISQGASYAPVLRQPCPACSAHPK